MGDLREWAVRNQPTEWDIPKAVPYTPRIPDRFDPLWYRIRWAYQPIVVTDVRTAMKIGSGA